MAHKQANDARGHLQAIVEVEEGLDLPEEIAVGKRFREFEGREGTASGLTAIPVHS